VQCTITDVQYRTEDWKTNSDRHGTTLGCYDYYAYDFTYTATSYESKEVRENRDKYYGKCADTGSVKDWNTQGPFNTEKDGGSPMVACWRPAGDADDIPDSYSCGNAECYKIYDPQNEMVDAVASAKKQIGIGNKLLGGGFAAAVIGAVAFLSLVYHCVVMCRAK